MNVQTKPIEHCNVQRSPIEPKRQINEIMVDVEPVQTLRVCFEWIDVFFNLAVGEVLPGGGLSVVNV